MPIACDLAGVPLRNPVLLAAGTAGTLHEMADVLDLTRVGGLVSKSITREPRDGNPATRILDLPGGAGMLNAIGLANPGIDAFERAYLPRAAALGCAVIGSAAGFSIDEYAAVAATLDEWGGSEHGHAVKAIELNVSCPNVKTGVEFGMSAAALRELLTAVRPLVRHARLFVKLSPLTPDIGAVARAAVEAGADALTICNTMPAMAIDVRTRRPRLANITGGLSGPGLHAPAVRLVHEVHRKVCRGARGPGAHVPIIGCGGVFTWQDAAEFILAGASAVQMGTALYADPRSPLRVVRGLERWTAAQGASSIAELVGALELP
jgi:dihydroorotate dehydrogenase (NAD+) catalytic subunit